MTKNKLLAGVVLSLLGCLVMIGTVNARVVPTVNPTNGDLTVCGPSYDYDGIYDDSEYGDAGEYLCVTIQGKNLGATTIGAGPTAPATSYGDYYQWGDNIPYTAINGHLDDYPADNVDRGDPYYDVEDVIDLQGPCNEGYHVPTNRDRYNLLYIWSEGESYDYYDIYDHDISQFYIDFQIPYAGTINSSNGLSSEGYQGASLWSSSSFMCNDFPCLIDICDTFGVGIANGYDSTNSLKSVRCFKNSGDLSSDTSSEQPIVAEILLSVIKGTLTIGTETGNLNLGEVNVSNSSQELSGSFGVNSFWVEDMIGAESGYYTTISVTDLTGTVLTHVISADNVYLKTAGNEPSYISGATVSDSKVVFSNDIKSWHNNWAEPVTYFNRQNTPSNLAGRVGKWGDNLQIKVTIPAHTPYDTYRGTITYTLYDLDL